MTSGIGKALLLLFLLTAVLAAQDVQELYDEAREALLAADPAAAERKVDLAMKLLEEDPRLDPNGLFRKKLLPKIKSDAAAMAAALQVFDELTREEQASLAFPDLPPTAAAVGKYAETAKEASERALRRRDQLVEAANLSPEYREALRRSAACRRLEAWAGEGVIDALAEKIGALADALIDSLRAADRRYAELQKQLARLKSSTASSRGEIEKLRKQVDELSAERLKYIDTLAQMLQADLPADVKPVKIAMAERNVGSVFRGVVQSEIKRVRETKEIDAASYRQMQEGYERLVRYHKVFVENGLSADQTALLKEYKSALDRMHVVKHRKWDSKMYLTVMISVALVVIVGLLIRQKKREAAAPTQP